MIVKIIMVGPKLDSGSVEPSLASPTFSSVGDFSSVSMPNASVSYLIISTSSINSPSVIFLSSNRMN